MSRVGVVVPVMNQFELALKALHSIKVPDGWTWQPYIIDNWAENKGVAAAWNIGCDLAASDNCDFILVINDDIAAAPFAVEHLAKIISTDETVGVITGTDCKFTHTVDQIVNHNYEIIDPDIIDAPDFAFFMLTSKSFSYIGRFDEGLYPAYFEDNDYCYRTILSGLRCVRSQTAKFFHYGSQTQNSGDPVVPSEIFERNREYYKQKWGGEPGSEVYTSPWQDQSLDWRATRSR